jgi:hypothetical protein
MKYTYDESILSDFHKDAFGFRPTESFFDNWDLQNKDGKQQIWDWLGDNMASRQNEERRYMEQKVKEFEDTISANLQQGAKDRVTAIEWIFQAQHKDILDDIARNATSELPFSVWTKEHSGMICYLEGLPLGKGHNGIQHEYRNEINNVLDGMENKLVDEYQNSLPNPSKYDTLEEQIDATQNKSLINLQNTIHGNR